MLWYTSISPVMPSVMTLTNTGLYEDPIHKKLACSPFEKFKKKSGFVLGYSLTQALFSISSLSYDFIENR